MQYVLCGGPPIGKRVRERFLDRFPSVKFMTNGKRCQIRLCALRQEKRWKQMREASCACEGQQLMQGYTNEDCQPDEAGWYHTGQVGHLDRHGNVFISGYQERSHRSRRTTGTVHEHSLTPLSCRRFGIPLAEVEDVLLTHPSITDAAVINVADRSKEQKTKAFVVQRDETFTAEDVYRFVDGKRRNFFIPTVLFFENSVELYFVIILHQKPTA
ncbi:hypothetical protein COOONC_13541 [Cooperia oncophora]